MLLSIYFNQNGCTQFIAYFGIKWPYSVKMNLKGPLSRDSQFKSHFYLGDRKTDDRVKVSMPPLFEGLSINNTETRGI